MDQELIYKYCLQASHRLRLQDKDIAHEAWLELRNVRDIKLEHLSYYCYVVVKHIAWKKWKQDQLELDRSLEMITPVVHIPNQLELLIAPHHPTVAKLAASFAPQYREILQRISDNESNLEIQDHMHLTYREFANLRMKAIAKARERFHRIP